MQHKTALHIANPGNIQWRATKTKALHIANPRQYKGQARRVHEATLLVVAIILSRRLVHTRVPKLVPTTNTLLELLQRDDLTADTLVHLVPVLDETLRGPVIHRGHVTEATRGLPVEQHADTRRARPFEPLMDLSLIHI